MKHNEISSPSLVIRAGEGKKFDVLGAHLVWKARGADTQDTFTLAEQTLAPADSIPRHRHPYPETFYVIAGEVEFTFFDVPAGTPHILRKGDTVVVPSNMYHAIKNAGEADAILLDIAALAHQQFFDAVQHEASGWHDLDPLDAMGRVAQIGQQYALEFWKGD
jgi:quercetin dioxygenase-like cupin family protein